MTVVSIGFVEGVADMPLSGFTAGDLNTRVHEGSEIAKTYYQYCSNAFACRSHGVNRFLVAMACAAAV